MGSARASEEKRATRCSRSSAKTGRFSAILRVLAKKNDGEQPGHVEQKSAERRALERS